VTNGKPVKAVLSFVTRKVFVGTNFELEKSLVDFNIDGLPGSVSLNDYTSSILTWSLVGT
jgi:hypothetical protein